MTEITPKKEECNHTVLSSVADNDYLCEKCNTHFTDEEVSKIAMERQPKRKDFQ